MLFIPSWIEDRRCGARPNETNGLQLFLSSFSKKKKRERESFLLPFFHSKRWLRNYQEKRGEIEWNYYNVEFNFSFLIWNIRSCSRNLFIMMLNVERIFIEILRTKMRGERERERGGFSRRISKNVRLRSFWSLLSSMFLRSFFRRAGYFSRGTYAMPLNFRPT